MIKKIGITILVLLLLAQFIRPEPNDGVAMGPNDISHVMTVPAPVMNILKTSCYDCHSDHTNYPWYSKITPVNWWLNHHIEEGKSELNFSQFATYPIKKQQKKLEETAELVQKGAMPLYTYTWIHKEAKLTNQQKQVLTDWVHAAGAEHLGSEYR